MNYQHAFHAGNFADVHKHVVLVRILEHLRQKPAPFRVIDSHAGSGGYDLSAVEPTRSGEWHEGIERLWHACRLDGPDRAPVIAGEAAALLGPYLNAVAAFNVDGALRRYPGSPLIARSLLRASDRLIACESTPRANAALTAALRGDPRTKALAIDGWTALGAYLPPNERRGLVLIDPPFEEASDFVRLSETVEMGCRKWPTGIYLLWYPIKTRAAPDALAHRLRKLNVAKMLRCELLVRPPQPDAGLVGSGLIVVNPPFTLERDLQVLLPALAGLFSAQAPPRIEWLAAER